MTTPKENANALADFIESGKRTWDISLCETCFFGQYRDLRAGNDWGNLAEFLALTTSDDHRPSQMGDLTMPDGYQHENSQDIYTRAAAVAVLRHLAATGRVEWHAYACPLCGQHITDGKPCGCGARNA